MGEAVDTCQAKESRLAEGLQMKQVSIHKQMNSSMNKNSHKQSEPTRMAICHALKWKAMLLLAEGLQIINNL